MSDTNVNLSESELAALAEARRFAWIKRKFINTKRYRRQYIRETQRLRRERRLADGFISFTLFCKLTTRRFYTPSAAACCRDCGRYDTQMAADLRKFNTGFSACCGTRLVSPEEYRAS